ncbi:MAG: flavodoxin family protein [Candidatus Aenigmatarchaeota archaeon]|nr:MAG: flavodoxin family protein [Candidatus Aenigmarchaeota archaeon]
MKVIGICGSHREKSSTLFFLKKAMDAIEKEGIETEIITLWDKDIRPCTVCDLCKTKYACSQDDDVMGMLEKLVDSDAIIMASPAYCAMVSGRMKNLMDRSLPVRRNGMRLSGKVGGAISVGASRNGGQELVCQQIHTWMGLQEMTTVTDKDTAHFGGIAWVARGTNPGDDKTGIETCENLGRKICEILKG